MKFRFMSKTAIAAIMLAGASLTLNACAPTIATQLPYDQKYKVSVAETIERLEVYVRPDGMNLTARDRGAMQQFVNLYGMEGDGAMFLNVPSNSAGAPGIRQAQAEIQNLMVQGGLANAPIQTGQYGAAPGAQAPVVLSFRRLAVVPMNCNLNEDLMRTYNNQSYDNFGCAARANFAQMIGDPKQLLQPYGMDTAHTKRRTTSFEKWVAGENPASAQPARQAVSAGTK